MKVLLLAGLYHKGELRREAKLKPFTGEMEQHISQILSLPVATPVKVSKLLCCFVESVSSVPMTNELAEQLCVADRQLLVLRLAQLLEGDQVWLHPDCGQCNEPFDLGYQRSQLPVSAVSEQVLIKSFEQGIEVDLGDLSLKFRPPNGSDQIAISSLNNDSALSCLIERLSLNKDLKETSVLASLTVEQVNTIAEALDAVTPQLAGELKTQCPNCELEQTVLLDPYHMQGLSEEYLMQDIHYLAIHYHWSEADIMCLPRQRRRQYIQLISESGGYHE